MRSPVRQCSQGQGPEAKGQETRSFSVSLMLELCWVDSAETEIITLALGQQYMKLENHERTI